MTKRYSLALTSNGVVILDGLDKAHARPQYTPNDANTVMDWLNGKDRPLKIHGRDRPMLIADRARDNAQRSGNPQLAAYAAGMRQLRGE